LSTSLNHLAENLRREGRLDVVEVVYVDWGSEVPVSSVVELSQEAAAMVRFVEVGSDLIAGLGDQGAFHTTLAVNVGVRRSYGAYIMLTDSDCLMRRSALASLLRLLDGQLDPEFDPTRHILPIRRIQIPYDIVRRAPSLHAWDEILQALQPGARTESPSTGCLGGFSAGQLMHRALWHEFEGYNETLRRPWGWSDNELMLRVTQKYGWADLAAYGVMAFHMEHGPRRRWWSATDLPKRDPDKVNMMLVAASTKPNGPHWGLASRDLPIRRATASKNVSPHDPRGAAVAPLHHKLTDRASLQAASSTAYVQDSMRRVLSHCAQMYGRESDQAEAQCLATVISFVSEASPLNFCYVGDLVESLLFGVFTEHTAIEAWLVQPWLEGESSTQPCHPGLLSQVLEQSMYRGYARILSGNAVDMLASLPDRCGIELALVNTSRREQQTNRVVEEIVTRLGRGGIAVVYGPQLSKELERYDRVSTEDVSSAIKAGRPFDPARRPFGQSLGQLDLLRVVTVKPDCLTVVVRQPRTQETSG